LSPKSHIVLLDVARPPTCRWSSARHGQKSIAILEIH
jgi:hypothetical protein